MQYPADWLAARQIIDSSAQRGSVLLLPWAAYRRYPWNNGEAVYDPWNKLLSREVVSNDGPEVGTKTLAQESAASIRLNRIVSASGPLTRQLRAAGVRYVVVDAGPLLTAPSASLALGEPRDASQASGRPGRPGQPRPGGFPAAWSRLSVMWEAAPAPRSFYIYVVIRQLPEDCRTEGPTR